MFYDKNYVRNVKYVPLESIASLVLSHQQLIDLRHKDNYNHSHIKGFINIPYNTIQNNLHLINKKFPIYLLCDTGKQSEILAETLNKYGYDAYSFIGGYMHIQNNTNHYF